MKTLVLAGNKKQYENWIKEKKYDRADYPYVCCREDAAGYHNKEFLIVGTFWNNPLWGYVKSLMYYTEEE